jgi:hypothetical protein
MRNWVLQTAKLSALIEMFNQPDDIGAQTFGADWGW